MVRSLVPSLFLASRPHTVRYQQSERVASWKRDGRVPTLNYLQVQLQIQLSWNRANLSSPHIYYHNNSNM